MNQTDLVIRGRRVITENAVGPASVHISLGRIIAIAGFDEVPSDSEIVEADEDSIVMPGLVDTHVHVNEPGRTDWEGFETATRAADAGGVTTIVDMPLNSIPVTTTVESLEQKVRAAAGHATVDYAFWGGVVPGNTAQLAPLAEAGVAGFKCFLVASGIDEFPSVSAADLYPAMTRLAELGLPLLVHAELPGPIARAARSTADSRRYASWLAARPPEAELEAIDLALGLCRKTGCHVHIVHLAAAAALDRLRDARREGLPITVETCPHY